MIPSLFVVYQDKPHIVRRSNALPRKRSIDRRKSPTSIIVFPVALYRASTPDTAAAVRRLLSARGRAFYTVSRAGYILYRISHVGTFSPLPRAYHFPLAGAARINTASSFLRKGT